MSIHYHNRRRVHQEIETELEATYWESLDQMLAHMEIISITVPTRPAFHLLSELRLKLIKPHTYIVNTSRGEVINEAALTHAGERGDCRRRPRRTEHEPAVNPKLLHWRTSSLPHIPATLEGRVDMGEKVIVNIKTFADGHTPLIGWETMF